MATRLDLAHAGAAAVERLRRLAAAVTPRFADWCLITLLDEPDIARWTPMPSPFASANDRG